MSIWIIKDWADNLLFNGKEFDSFDNAEQFLCEHFENKELDYEENRGDIYIEVKGE